MPVPNTTGTATQWSLQLQLRPSGHPVITVQESISLRRPKLLTGKRCCPHFILFYDDNDADDAANADDADNANDADDGEARLA
jgi:hypothetical protein